MLKVRLIIPIQSASGKLHRGSNCHFRYYKKDRTTYLCEREENYQYSRSAEQAAMRRDFGSRSHAVAEWLRTNENPPTEAYLALRREFDSQTRYTRWPSFLMSHLRL